jgi:hypothetical protein
MRGVGCPNGTRSEAVSLFSREQVDYTSTGAVVAGIQIF